jgi:Mg2+ and Co2+ transporter CorA
VRWVGLHDPGPEELAAVQRELDLPQPLVDGLAKASRRSSLELVGGHRRSRPRSPAFRRSRWL